LSLWSPTNKKDIYVLWREAEASHGHRPAGGDWSRIWSWNRTSKTSHSAT